MNKKLKFTITTIWILLTRWFDAFSTYRHTPDLGKEANPLVSIFGFGWTPLLVVIVVDIFVALLGPGRRRRRTFSMLMFF
mgnify:CR=1 FL=1